MSTPQKPEILRGVHRNSEVRFTFITKGGEPVWISGTVLGFTGNEDGYTGINISLSVSAKVPGKHAGDQMWLGLRGIKANPDTGLIIPVSKKERATGTGAAQYLGPSDAQVRYALSLCGRTCPGGGNFYQPAEAEFRAMSRTEISEWIDMAKDELGAWA